MARGRPAGATTKGKTDRTSIQIRVPLAEREAFEARALAVGLSLGEWARTLLRRDAGMWTGQEDKMSKTDWTFEGYWNAVLGANRTAADVVREFGLDPADQNGVDEWLGNAESEAWLQGGHGPFVPGDWVDLHQTAVDMLCAVTVG